MGRSLFFLLFVGALVVLASFCFIIIDEREQGFRTLLDDPDFALPGGIYKNKAELTEPGIYVRIPGLHDVYRFDRRRLHYDATKAFEGLTKENLLISLDYYAIWQIEDPRKFYEAFTNTQRAIKRLDDVTYSAVQKTVTQYSLADLLAAKREEITRQIAEASNAELQPKGLRILDLRVRGTDYPDTNLKQIFDRMRTERNRFALKFRAEGDEQAREIRSNADRESQVIRAGAEREATKMRGEGDAEAMRIYAEAYNQDPEFYSFMRSLEAYRTALDDQTTLILSKEMPFLKHLFDKGTGAKARKR